jgi:hypothetical protein
MTDFWFRTLGTRHTRLTQPCNSILLAAIQVCWTQPVRSETRTVMPSMLISMTEALLVI